MSGEARVRALEVEFGAELTRLEGLISIAELNNRWCFLPRLAIENLNRRAEETPLHLDGGTFCHALQ
jgi:hypothetical protein